MVMVKLLTSQEVAAQLRVPVKTLHHWRRDGKGPKGKKMGVRVVYREEDVQAWLDAQFDEGDAAPRSA
jgi:predicted DNA-binding transcriptional regulator AlpA